MPETSNLISQFYVELDGKPAPAELMRALYEITIETSLHMPDAATLLVHDPQLRWVDEEKFSPGKAIQIAAKSTARKSREQTVFDGEIVELESDFGSNAHHLIVRAFDRLHRLGRGRHVRTFQDVKDSDLVQQLARDAKLETDASETRRVHAHLFQNNQTNLEFLRMRARDLGYLLYVRGRKLVFKPPADHSRDGEKPIELEWGKGLAEFRPRLTTIGQASNIVVRGWDPDRQREIVAETGDGKGARDIGHKKRGGETAKDAFNLDTTYLAAHQPVRSQQEAGHLAQALADRQAERFIEAEGACGGNPDLIAGSSVKLKGLGKRFSGTYFVTAAMHSYSAQGYATRFSISGQTPASLLRILRGDGDDRERRFHLVVGVVTDNNDPARLGRVKVKYPWLSAEQTSDWARVVSPGAGRKRGLQFIPQVEDEVLVGFEMGDVHHPYVLGGLWNGQAPPHEPEQVDKIIIADPHGNHIELSEEGVTIKGGTINLN